jgi:hypothetical protein
LYKRARFGTSLPRPLPGILAVLPYFPCLAAPYV